MWKKDGSLAELVRNRYKSFDSELGALIEVYMFSNLFSTWNTEFHNDKI